MPRRRRAYRLLAFDPGERTGFVLVRVAGGFRPTGTAKCGPDRFRIEEQGVLTVREMGYQLRRLVRAADRVAYETWRLYPDYAQVMVGNDMQPSQVVGMIRYEAWQQDRPIEGHAADIKKFAVATMPEWLKAHMAKSSEQHDQDAIMHAWFVARRHFYREDT